MTHRTRAIFFDLGGTLFSNKQIPEVNMPVLIEAGRRLGIGDDPMVIGAAYMKATMAVNERYKDRAFYMHSDLFFDTYRELAQAMDVEIEQSLLDWIYESQRECMCTRIVLREDCLATLEGLRERGLSLSLVSNIDDDYLHPMMENLGLKPFFHHWSSSHEAQSCKPDRGFFDYACRKAGFDPAEVLFVGDSRQHDVAGARAAGMVPVLIEEKRGQSILDSGDAEPDYTIGTLSELLPLVDERAR